MSRFGLQLIKQGLGLLIGLAIGTAWSLMSDSMPPVVRAGHTGTADIRLQDPNQTFAQTIDSALSVAFTASGQTELAGFLDVRNAGTTAADNFPNGYSLSVAAGGSPIGASAILNNALRVRVESKGVIGQTNDCAPSPGSAASPGTGNIEVVVQDTAWAGLLFSNRPALDTFSSQERLCFYLTLPPSSDGVGGGSVTYALSFTAVGNE